MKSATSKPKRTIAKSRASAPEIYVKIGSGDFWKPAMAKASIRVRSGEYQYLTWRDGGQVRTFYLGRKKKSLSNRIPTRRRPAAARRRRAGRPSV